MDADTLKEIVDERDVRYQAEDRLRAEALKIKEEGDAKALQLARENQVLKEAQHNGAIDLLKESVARQVPREMFDQRLEELARRINKNENYIASQTGTSQGKLSARGLLFSSIAAGGGLAGVIIAALALLH